MGQYYKPTLIDKDGKMKTFYSHKYRNGLKLMEHSWIGNNFVAAVMHELFNNPHRIWWLGDCAEIGDFKNKKYRLLAKDRRKAWGDKCDINDNNEEWIFDNAYLINHDKNSFVQLEAYGKGWQVCPLPLLTAVGNGKGGGDYFSDCNADIVGAWAGNELEVSFNKPDGYWDATDDYYFEEN